MSDFVDIRVDDNYIPGYLAVPESGSGPGVLLLHAWWGLNDFMKDLAERLALEGFVTLAPDLYNGPTADTIEEADQLSSSANPQEVIKRAIGALDLLRAHPAVQGQTLGGVAFSFGAAYLIWLNGLQHEPSALVLFYGGPDMALSVEGFATNTNAAFLGHFAEQDEFESIDDMRELERQLQAAGKEGTFHVYPGTGHWFFEDDRQAYDPDAARLAWEWTVEFLHRHLDVESDEA